MGRSNALTSPPPGGEGLGVGGTPTSIVLQSPLPCPSPTRGEGNRRGISWIAQIAVSVVTLAALLFLTALDATAQSRRERPPEEGPEQYPAGQHRDDTFYFCTACHGFKIIAQQGMSRDRWSDTFDTMTKRHGMPDVQGEQRDQMLDYLSSTYPERRAPGGWKNPFENK